MLRDFMDANRRLSRRLVGRLPHARRDPRKAYVPVVANRMNEPREQTVVVDVGGGKTCHFAQYKEPGRNIRIVAVDVSPEQLEHNTDVDEKRVADVTRGLPFDDAEADLIVSRSVLEHLRDLEAFVAEANRVLKPGGYFIHLLPCKFSPVSIVNQAIPNKLAKRILQVILPGSRGRLGFPAFYDHCYPAGLERLLRRHGFAIDDLAVSYHQRDYFNFFFPLLVLMVLYELLIFR